MRPEVCFSSLKVHKCLKSAAGALKVPLRLACGKAWFPVEGAVGELLRVGPGWQKLGPLGYLTGGYIKTSVSQF